MQRARFLSGITLLLMLCAPETWADSPARRDGNWWRTMSVVEKESYAVGVFDGMEIGQDFTVWKYANSQDRTEQKCTGQARIAYTEYSRKFTQNVTNGQLVDGLDQFFNDYKNRRIEVYGAIWLVVNGIAGTPQKELDFMIESWRRNAN